MAATQPPTLIDAQLASAVALFESLEWTLPPYIRLGVIKEIAARVRSASDQFQQVDEEIRHLYDADYLAAMLVERYPAVVHVRDFVPAISDAFEAAALGNWNGAITTLLPAIEGILRRARTQLSPTAPQGTQWLIGALTALIGRRSRETAISQRHTDPVVLDRARRADAEIDAMIEGFRNFARDFMLRGTQQYSGRTGLNRHAILHGIDSTSFARPGTFYRLITLLDILCFAFTFDTPGAPTLAPEDTPRSIARADYYRSLTALAATRPA